MALSLAPAISVAQPLDAEKRAAVEKFQRAQELYKEGEFAAAVALLEELREVRKEPVLLYNLARAHEGLGDVEAALEAYEAYLAEAPNVEGRGGIEKRIETLRAQLKKLETTPSPDPAPVVERPPAPEEDAVSLAAPIVIASVGLAGVAVGGVLGAVSQRRRDDAEVALTQTGAQELHDQAGTFATSANVMFAVGGVVAAAGVTWLIVELAGASSESQVAFTHDGFRVRF
jgi:tetratricopeptide (TPR) repeat protein